MTEEIQDWTAEEIRNLRIGRQFVYCATCKAKHFDTCMKMSEVTGKPAPCKCRYGQSCSS